VLISTRPFRRVRTGAAAGTEMLSLAGSTGEFT